MFEKPEIKRPVFMVGSGRCGSTIIFEALSVHEDVGWLSNYNKLLPIFDIVSVMPRIYNLPFFNRLSRGEKKQYNQGENFLNLLRPIPFECFIKWNLMCNEFEWTFLKDKTATDKEKRKVRKTVRNILYWQNKKRFVAKYTGPTRMTFIKSIFPDAVFIHIKRNPIAVVYSLLNVDFWQKYGKTRPRWKDGLPENWQEEWENYNKSPLALTAIQYRTIMQICEQEKQNLNSDDYKEFRYEDFIERPQDIMSEILTVSDLPKSAKIEEFIKQHNYTNGNQKHLDRISEEEKNMVEQIIDGWR